MTSTGASLVAQMVKTLPAVRETQVPSLNLQYFGHLLRRADSFEKTLMLGKTEVRR